MTVAAPPRTAEKLASRAGDCPLCTDPVEKGDPIRLITPALDWGHSGCAADYFEVYPLDEDREGDE